MCAVTLLQNVLNLEDIKDIMTTCDQKRQPNIMKQRHKHTHTCGQAFFSLSLNHFLNYSLQCKYTYRIFSDALSN